MYEDSFTVKEILQQDIVITTIYRNVISSAKFIYFCGQIVV